MIRLQTKTERSTGKTRQQKHVALPLMSAFLLSLFASSAIANRPAMEDRGETFNEAATDIDEDDSQARPEMANDGQPEAPSSVDLMMQQKTQQTYQTGDVVQLPPKEMQPGETLKIQLLDSPRRGMSMNKVQVEYGQPITISDSVGKPPITSWTYNDRVVYFEYSTVLHVVAR